MTIFGCLSPWTTILIVAVGPLFIVPNYRLLVNGKDNKLSMATDFKNVSYSRISSSKNDETFKLTCKENFIIVWNNTKHYIALTAAIFCEYISLQSIITTLAFQNATFGPRDHYVFYTLALAVGEIVGRSYGMISSLVKPGIKPYPRYAWCFFWVFIVVIMLFLLFASWYRFLPSVSIVLTSLVLLGGFIGALCVSVFAVAGEDETLSVKREISRACLVSSLTVGIIPASFLGLVIEPVMREHCEFVALSTELCFTRNTHAWNASTSCRVF